MNQSCAEYTFGLSYFSEVSAEITLICTHDIARFEATHPMDTVPISDWFHFSNTTCETDPLVVECETIHSALFELGNQLYEGPRRLLEDNQHVQHPRTQFFSDLYFAFVYGEWFPAAKRIPSGWEHEVGLKIRE